MELEFDKEIDAILRKAREPVAVGLASENAAHLDADVIAAFAENALPEQAKTLYMEHFADCGGCRKLLSQAVLMNAEAVATPVSSSVTAAVVAVIPWYQSLFKTSNLAFTMGALVLAFSGILGYLALQDRTQNSSTTVSESKAPENNRGPYYSGESSTSNSNAFSAANIASNAAATNTSTSNSTTTMPEYSSNTAVHPGGPSPGVSGANDLDKVTTANGDSTEPAKPVAAAPPPVDQPVSREADEKTSGEDKQKDLRKDTELAGRRKADDDRMARDAVPSTAKKTGPSRATGPRNNQQEMNVQTQSVMGMTAPTRSAGGKNFVSRNGAWYDAAYHGQKTKNVRRGTDEYIRLDSGLRSIAESLGGTVVVVWKEKAFRIQ